MAKPTERSENSWGILGDVGFSSILDTLAFLALDLDHSNLKYSYTKYTLIPLSKGVKEKVECFEIP